MRTRAITGFFFVLVMLASVLFGAYTFTIFFLLLGLLCSEEFYRITTTETVKPQKRWGIALAALLYLPISLHFFLGQDLRYALLIIPASVMIIIAELYRHHPNPFHNIAYTFLGVFLIVVPFCLFYMIAFSDGTYNLHYPLAFLIMLWSNDTGAYLFGIKLGKHKLFERHSPKKTWEGFAGGILTGLLAAFIISIFFKELPIIHWLGIALCISVAGTFGDLSESMLKRSLDVKDSGNILPGHGGLLDRFDGLFLAAPIVYVYLQFVV